LDFLKVGIHFFEIFDYMDPISFFTLIHLLFAIAFNSFFFKKLIAFWTFRIKSLSGFAYKILYRKFTLTFGGTAFLWAFRSSGFGNAFGFLCEFRIVQKLLDVTWKEKFGFWIKLYLNIGPFGYLLFSYGFLESFISLEKHIHFLLSL